MSSDFGLKIGLDGEKEFKKALTEINQSFKVLGSEMKLVDSEFDKNDKSIEALTARNKVLNSEIDTQKQKIETLNNVPCGSFRTTRRTLASASSIKNQTLSERFALFPQRMPEKIQNRGL